MKQLDHIAKALQSGEDFVTATIVDAEGSTPGRVGFRIVVHPDRAEGTVGGGALEQKVIAEARDMLALKKDSRLVRFNLSELEMTCGGSVSVFFEAFFGKPPLWIFGAGHIARALTPIASSIGFRITVADNREGFAVAESFPPGTGLLTGEYGASLEKVPSGAYAVIVTHGHAHDEEALLALAAMEPPLPYIGMIGSRQKVLASRELLAKEGKDGKNVYAPIGLALGGQTAEEIALCIAAEILGVYNKKTKLPHCRMEP